MHVQRHNARGTIAEARDPYAKAVRAVMDDFFADPSNPYTAAIIDRVKGVRADLHRASAVAEARTHILEVVKRM